MSPSNELNEISGMHAGMHDKISPTAKITAYWRSLSDIPFSKEIAAAIGAEQTAAQLLGDRFSVMKNFSPVILEARYKAIDAGLKRCGARNVLEMAYGLSPRGLDLAARNIKYAGTDLPQLLSESAPVITGIAERLGIRGEYLRLQPANVLSKAQLQEAIEYFKGGECCFCNEGLLMYLDKEEKAVMAENIRELLAGPGGAWITTDIAYKDIRTKLFDALKPDLRKLFETTLGSISAQVGRNIAGNDFRDEEEAVKFYEDLGFRIKKFSFYDGSYHLSTLSNVPDEMKEPILITLSASQAWILTPLN